MKEVQAVAADQGGKKTGLEEGALPCGGMGDRDRHPFHPW